MAQIQHETQQADPITEAFVADRQAFWSRFTGFTFWTAIVLVLLLLGLWWFVA